MDLLALVEVDGAPGVSVKTDPKIRALLEQVVKSRLEMVLRKLADRKNDDDT